jgi:hypothetical protein
VGLFHGKEDSWIVDQLNGGADENSQSRDIESREDARRRVGFHYKEEIGVWITFLSSHVVLRHMVRFPGYKY